MLLIRTEQMRLMNEWRNQQFYQILKQQLIVSNKHITRAYDDEELLAIIRVSVLCAQQFGMRGELAIRALALLRLEHRERFNPKAIDQYRILTQTKLPGLDRVELIQRLLHKA